MRVRIQSTQSEEVIDTNSDGLYRVHSLALFSHLRGPCVVFMMQLTVAAGLDSTALRNETQTQTRTVHWARRKLDSLMPQLLSSHRLL